MDSNTVSFLSGMGATAFGFLLTMIWEYVKTRRDNNSIKELIKGSILKELDMNITVSKMDIDLLNQDNAYLQSKKVNLEILLYFNNKSWDLVISSLDKIKICKENLDKIAVMHILISRINETIRMKEEFRINSGALSNATERMMIYNNLILNLVNSYVKNYIDLAQKITTFENEWK